MPGRKSTEAECRSHHAVAVLTGGGDLDRLVKVVLAQFLQPLSSFHTLICCKEGEGFHVHALAGAVFTYIVWVSPAMKACPLPSSIAFVKRELPAFRWLPIFLPEG